MSSPMRVGGEVMRGGGGTRLCNPWPHSVCTPRTHQEHARRTLGALETGSALVHHAHMCCMFAGHALEARWVCAHGALGVRQTSVDEHTTHAQHVLRVCLALVQRALRMSGVLLACTFMRRAPRTFLCIPTHTTNDDECMALVQRARPTSSAC